MVLSGNLDAQRRRAELVGLAESSDGVHIETAAERFGVSSMTIRRDLQELEAEGRVRRVRGGATGMPGPRPFEARSALRANAKRAIALKALDLVPRAGLVGFDASTTISTLAARIGPRDGLTVHTNSLESFQLLHPLDGVTAVLSGGSLETTTGSFVGPVARQSMRAVYFDTFFASAAGLDAVDGTSEVSAEEAEVKQIMAAHAQRTVLCLDSSKLHLRGVARSLDMSAVDVLITELDPADERLDAFREIADIR